MKDIFELFGLALGIKTKEAKQEIIKRSVTEEACERFNIIEKDNQTVLTYQNVVITTAEESSDSLVQKLFALRNEYIKDKLKEYTNESN